MRLRLIETGGTICMVDGPGGLRPARGRVATALGRMQPGLMLSAEAIEPLVDSAEVGPALWNDLLDRIAQADGPVLITHGTDTMAYTGAALDAALAPCDRVVILCGAMQPLGQADGDGEGNLALALGAISAARPGVWLAFAGRLMPAGRLTKTHSSQADAFSEAGEQSDAPFSPALRFDPRCRLAVVTVTPGLDPATLEAMLAPLDGAVLRVFGAGTVPAALGPPLARAVARGCVVLAISQTAQGGLSPGAYAAGAPMWQAGVENGQALSVEQALTRLWLRLSATARH